MRRSPDPPHTHTHTPRPCEATADILIDRFAFLRMDLSLDWDIEWLELLTDQRPVEIFRPACLIARSGLTESVEALWRQKFPRSTAWSRAGDAAARSVDDADAAGAEHVDEVCSEADPADDDDSNGDDDDDQGSGSEEPRHNGVSSSCARCQSLYHVGARMLCGRSIG